MIEREFVLDPDNSVDKRAMLDADRFGYLSLRYVAKLNPAHVVLPGYKGNKLGMANSANNPDLLRQALCAEDTGRSS